MRLVVMVAVLALAGCGDNSMSTSEAERKAAPLIESESFDTPVRVVGDVDCVAGNDEWACSADVRVPGAGVQRVGGVLRCDMRCVWIPGT